MTLLIGERYRDRLLKSLSQLCQEILWLPDNPALDPRLAGHADLSVFSADDGHVVVGEALYDRFVNLFTYKSVTISASQKQGPVYPDDAGLCVCRTGKYTIYNPRTVDPAAEATITGVRIAVPQGYTKCSVCVVSDDAIITADDVIARRAAEHSMDVLKITPGHIRLDGYGYGFIGGASFLPDSHTMAFTGTLDDHPDKSAILSFLAKHGVSPVYLTQEPIFDIGGAIALP